MAMNKKKANIIYPVCILYDKKRFRFNYNVDYVLNHTIFVWPWGYDN